MTHALRTQRVVSRFMDSEIEALLVTNATNVRYLTGFSGTNGQVLITRDGATFFSDPRYKARAEAVVEGAGVVIYRDRLAEVLADYTHGLERLGFEASSMSVADRDDLAPATGAAELVATRGLVESVRRTKEDEELLLIRDAARITDETFAVVLDRLRAGRTEKEVAWEIIATFRALGADAAFDPIVGSGELSAHVHHSPTDREIAPGDAVLLDLGARCDGYCADLTRTVVVGRAEGPVADVYALVAEAQEAALGAADSGAACRSVDGEARRVIEAAGHGEHFGHGLGHGVGLDIHESPRLHPSSADSLLERDVVTVEPGVYVPGAFGVRIEDCVLVTSAGVEVLSKAPKGELLEV